MDRSGQPHSGYDRGRQKVPAWRQTLAPQPNGLGRPQLAARQFDPMDRIVDSRRGDVQAVGHLGNGEHAVGWRSKGCGLTFSQCGG
jgi:hypothetical protein